jgi:hypothetical protein
MRSKKDDGSFKVFLPVAGSGLTFNEILIWSWLVRADRRNRPATKKEIQQATGLNFRTIKRGLDRLGQMGLIVADGGTHETGNDRRGWRAVKNDRFRERLLSHDEIVKARDNVPHWSQFLLYFSFCPVVGYNLNEAAVYWLARRFGRRGRTFHQSTFTTLLGIDRGTMRGIARRIADAINWEASEVKGKLSPRASEPAGPSDAFLDQHRWHIDMMAERSGRSVAEIMADVSTVHRQRGERGAAEWIVASSLS